MSFICDISGKVSKPGEKPIKVVTKTRNKEYFEKRTDKKTGVATLIKVGQGTEIVQEINVSKESFAKMNKGK